MTGVIQPIQASLPGIDPLFAQGPMQITTFNPAAGNRTTVISFSSLLVDGIDKVDGKIAEADSMVRAFALNDNAMPVHQVTFALEEARQSLELMIQVRNRLVEGVQQLMNMQI